MTPASALDIAVDLAYSIWLSHLAAQPPPRQPPEFVFPTHFLGHAIFYITTFFHHTNCLVCRIRCSPFCAQTVFARIDGWFFLVVVLGFINPLVAPSVIEYTTQPNTYWQMFFFTVPIPLVGLLAPGMSRLLRYKLHRWRSFITIPALLCYMALLADAPSSVFCNIKHSPTNVCAPTVPNNHSGSCL